jgi:AraC-like DNA-binding protein
MTTITSTVVHQADVQFREAAAVLRPHVGCFWIITADRDAAIRIVPDLSTSISTELQDGRMSGWWLRGPLVRPDERRFPSPVTIVGVRLRPGVAFLLSAIAAEAIIGRRIRASAIDSFRELVTTSPAPRTPTDCIDVLERFLIQRLSHASVHDVVARAVEEIERDRGQSSVGDVAGRCGVSARHLNRLTRLWVGFGPKSLATIVRFQATLAEIDQAPSQPGAALAATTGYFDQAHLTTNLSRFAGATPRRLASHHAADFYKTRCDDLP